MSAPVDELDLGGAPREPRFARLSARARRLLVAAAVVVVAGTVAVVVAVGRDAPPPPPAAAPSFVQQPGAQTTVELYRDEAVCPAGATCRYEQAVSDGVEQAFRDAFPSAGYIGRMTVTNAGTGDVLEQTVQFTTGNLAKVTLTVVTAPDGTPDRAINAPDRREVANGGITFTAVRDGWLVTANAAGLPGQALPIRSAGDWVRSVPLP